MAHVWVVEGRKSPKHVRQPDTRLYTSRKMAWRMVQQLRSFQGFGAYPKAEYRVRKYVRQEQP